MSIKCTYKDEDGKECGHVNADGSSYCVKCGKLLDGVRQKIVVVKSEYDSKTKKVNDLEQEKGILNKRIATLSREQSDMRKRLNNSLEENKRLKRLADMEWYEKLWEDYDFIFYIAFFVFFIVGIYWYFSSGVREDKTLIIEQRDGHWGKAKGNDIILPFEYDSIVHDKFDTTYSRIYKGGHVGLINYTTGKTIVPCIYLEVGKPNSVSFRGKLIAVKKDNGKWHFVDYHGLPKGRQDQFDYANWWSTAEYGIVGAKDNGKMKYGYVDERGDVKILCKYAVPRNFFEGLALVKNSKDGPWICINENGEEQYKLKYTLGDIYQESLMAVANDSEWTSKTLFGFVDKKGELVIGMYFTPWVLGDGRICFPRFSNGKAEVHYMGKNGWIDKTGHFTPKE